jgi:hypothetical protein
VCVELYLHSLNTSSWYGAQLSIGTTFTILLRITSAPTVAEVERLYTTKEIRFLFHNMVDSQVPAV